MRENVVYQAVRVFTLLAAIAVPVFILIVPHGGSIPYHLAALVALFTIILRYPRLPRAITNEERIAFTGYAVYGATILISLVHTNFAKEAVGDLDTLLRPLWAIPVIFLFIRARLPEGILWFGLAIGAAAAGINAIYEHLTADQYVRAGGATSPVSYGNIALAMGFMTALAIPYFKRHGNAYIAIPLVALLLGLIASLLSGSRGGWIALPALLFMLVWNYWPSQYRRFAVTSVLGLLLATVIVVLIPQSGVMDRVNDAVTSAELYFEDPEEHGGSSVGQRFELWRAAWNMFLEKPIFGGGIGHSFNDYMREHVAAGEYHPATAVQTMPHNTLLDTLALRGLVGLASLLILWGTLAYIYIAAIRTGNMSLRMLGMAGLTLIVSYLFFGLTDSPMEYGAPLVFFSFYSALIVYAIANARLTLTIHDKK